MAAYSGEQSMKSLSVLPNDRQWVVWRIVRKNNRQSTFIKAQPWVIIFADLVAFGDNTLFHKVFIFLQYRHQFRSGQEYDRACLTYQT